MSWILILLHWFVEVKINIFIIFKNLESNYRRVKMPSERWQHHVKNVHTRACGYDCFVFFSVVM